jgi:hypothetical protein
MRRYFSFRKLRNREGQASVEYVLMLLLSLMAFLMVVRGVLGPAFEKFQRDLTSRVESTFFGGGRGGAALHRFRVRR